MLDAETTTAGVFAESTHHYDGWRFSIGLRADSATTENLLPEGAASGAGAGYAAALTKVYGDFDQKTTDTLLAAFIKGRFDLETGYWFMGLGQNMRVPDPTERYTNKTVSRVQMNEMNVTMPGWVGNPDLKPVTNHELDIGLRSALGDFTLDGTLFYSRLTDYIYLGSIQGSDNNTYKTYINLDAAIYGGDINLAYHPTPSWELSLASALQKGVKLDKPATHTDDDLADIPPLKNIAKVRYETPEWLGALEMVSIAKQTATDSDMEYQEPGGATLFNLKAGYTWRQRLTLSVGVDNLTDETYGLNNSFDRDPINPASTILVAEPGRFVHAGVSYRF